MIHLLRNRAVNSLMCFAMIGLCLYSNAMASQKQVWTQLKSHFSLKVDRSLQAMTQQQIKWHQSHPDAITDMSQNAKHYLAYVTQEAIAHKLPAELALIPFVESNYDPFAKSPKGASGLWQMMPEMATASSLKINHQLDERRDVIKSTQAAMRHLKYLHGRLDNRWDYAIAAYNAGEGRVRQAIKQSARTKIHWTAFLPSETRKYLPKVFALKLIIDNPGKYGLQLPDISAETYFSITPIRRSYAFGQMAELCGISTDDLHRLNPSWKGNAIQHGATAYVLIPKNKAFSCEKKTRKTALFNNLWAYHKVQKHDTLSRIAKHYQTSVDTIMSLNDLRNHQLTEHSHLIIRKGEKSRVAVSTDHHLKTAIVDQDNQGPLQITHFIKAGDTISAISQRYQLKIAHIAYWNRLKYPYHLTPNQTLTLWRHEKKPSHYSKHIVKQGETFSMIAKQYKISQKRLLSSNKIENINKLRLNQILTIPR